MGEVIRTDRFPKPKTQRQRERLRKKFARGPWPLSSKTAQVPEKEFQRRH